jgi:hypothetical protein
MRFVVPAMFILAIANGLFADVAYALTGTTGRLPVSPVLAVIIAACVRLLYRDAPAKGPFAVGAVLVLAAAVLVPSSLASWLALLCVAAIGIVADAPRANAYRLSAALATTQIWHASAFKVFAPVLTGGEAHILAFTLRLLGFAPEVNANVVHVFDDHTLVLLAGCSVFSDLGMIVLGWSAVFCLLHPDDRFPLKFVPVVALAAVSFNLSRLVLMALGPDWHTFMHDGIGAQMYDAAICLLVVSGGWFVQPTSAAVSRSRPARAVAPWGLLPSGLSRCDGGAVLAFAVLVVVSLSVKSVRYAARDASGWSDAKELIRHTVVAQGFDFGGTVAITTDRGIEGMIFKREGCSEPLVVALMGASSDTLPIITRYMDGTPVVMFLDGHRIDTWVVARFLAANVGEIAGNLVHGRKPVLVPLIAVSRPVRPEAPACLWPI